MALAIDASPGPPPHANQPSESASDRAVLPSPPPFRVVISEEDGEVVISARGDIDASTAPTLALALSSLLAGKHPSIVLDLTDVGVVDADRAWVIAESSRLFGQRGGRLSVATANAAVREVLESADLGWLLVDEPLDRAD